MRPNVYQSREELDCELKILTQQYFEYQKFDEKPEKGERKIADEMVILIGDIVDQYIESHPLENTKLIDLYKISLLEISYNASGFNFDV